MRILIGLLMVFTIASCGQDPAKENGPDNDRADYEKIGKRSDELDEPSEANKPVAQNLEGKSANEVLKLKYNKALLTCRFWVQAGDELFTSNTPNSSWSWDLLKDPLRSKKKRFTLSGRAIEENHGQQSHSQMDVKLIVKAVEITNSLHYTDADRTSYEMSFTPVIKMAYYVEGKNVFMPGVETIYKGPWLSNDIHEKFRSKLINQSNACRIPVNGFQSKFHQRLECTFDTEIKPEYQDQFRIVK